MNNNKDKLIELALLVKDGLDSYIKVHNNIFHEAATFKSLIKNIFGKGVPMESLCNEAEELIPLWDSIYLKVNSFKTSSYSNLTDKEKYYVDVLTKYVDALKKTVFTLVERQRLWGQGSKSFKNNPMTWEAYKKKENEYKRSVEEYMHVGQELNDANSIIFN